MEKNLSTHFPAKPLQLVGRLCKAAALALASVSSASVFRDSAAKSAGVAPRLSVMFRLAPASRTGTAEVLEAEQLRRGTSWRNCSAAA